MSKHSRDTNRNENIRLLKDKKWHVLGFGALMLGLTMIPIVNLVIIPVGVIASTLMWTDKINPS